MYKLVNSLMEILSNLSISKKDSEVLNGIVSSQASLQIKVELSAEEKLAVDILMKRNERILISHLQKMMEEANADKS